MTKRTNGILYCVRCIVRQIKFTVIITITIIIITMRYERNDILHGKFENYPSVVCCAMIVAKNWRCLLYIFLFFLWRFDSEDKKWTRQPTPTECNISWPCANVGRPERMIPCLCMLVMQSALGSRYCVCWLKGICAHRQTHRDANSVCGSWFAIQRSSIQYLIGCLAASTWATTSLSIAFFSHQYSIKTFWYEQFQWENTKNSTLYPKMVIFWWCDWCARLLIPCCWNSWRVQRFQLFDNYMEIFSFHVMSSPHVPPSLRLGWCSSLTVSRHDWMLVAAHPIHVQCTCIVSMHTKYFQCTK